MPIILYNYYRSTAAYRVRIALDYKGLPFEIADVNLLEGEHKTQEFKAKNPQARVPYLITEEAQFGQSMAMLEFLEERYPTPALLPEDLNLRAQVRYFANIISCDMHPLNNVAVLNYLRKSMQQNEEAVLAWYHHWLALGFTALEALLVARDYQGQSFCFGSTPTFAEVCLIPQVYNAKRFHYDLSHYPCLQALNDYCLQFPYFTRTYPEA